MLTRKQMELLEFITDYMDTSGGLSPSFEEMKTGVGLHSKSCVHRLIEALEKRGYIRRIRYLARCVEVLRLPGELKMTTADEIIASIRGLLDVYESQEKRPPFLRAVDGGS